MPSLELLFIVISCGLLFPVGCLQWLLMGTDNRYVKAQTFFEMLRVHTYSNIVRYLDINPNSSAISALNAQNICICMLDYLYVMKLTTKEL